jgi:hypothetical protein
MLRSPGGERRPLLGIPMVVNESFNIAGLPTTWGIPSFKDWTPKDDARLRYRRLAARSGALLRRLRPQADAGSRAASRPRPAGDPGAAAVLADELDPGRFKGAPYDIKSYPCWLARFCLLA